VLLGGSLLLAVLGITALVEGKLVLALVLLPAAVLAFLVGRMSKSTAELYKAGLTSTPPFRRHEWAMFYGFWFLLATMLFVADLGGAATFVIAFGAFFAFMILLLRRRERARG
jgi:hypothetical protein